jgi:hypothetical protein
MLLTASTLIGSDLTLAIPQRVTAPHTVRHRDRVQRVLHARPHPDPLVAVQE